MKLYLTSVSMTKIEYASIENGYDKFVISRDGYSSITDVPEIIRVDYWEVVE